jgi:multicomponent Na+:H+ antiporter subunit E
MSYLAGLLIALTVFWFALSGLTSPYFLVLAVVAVLLALWLSARLGVIGRDASPYHRLPLLLPYVVWLLGQIVKSNIAVIARVVGQRSAIDPAMVSIKTKARTDLGKALFANSITLTPGTVTVDVDGDTLKVHALVRENATPASFDQIDRRAARAADGAKRKV